MKKNTIITHLFLFSLLLVGCNNNKEESPIGEITNNDTQIRPIDGPIDGGSIVTGSTPKFLYIDNCDGRSPSKKQILNNTVSAFNAYDITSTLVPRREGFIFEGFSVGSFENELLSETEITVLENNSILYAHWSPVSAGAQVLYEGMVFDRNLGVQTLPIPSINDFTSFLIPYHYKEVVLQYAFKGVGIYQRLHANTISITGTPSSYNFSMDIPAPVYQPSTADVYNMYSLNVNYSATDYHVPHAEGNTTTIGYSIMLGGVTKYREALIKII